jgi:hypothetical protein
MRKTPAGPADGDFDGDGIITGRDVATVARLMHEYKDAHPGSQSIPEPATLSLLALGGAALLRRKARS